MYKKYYNISYGIYHIIVRKGNAILNDNAKSWPKQHLRRVICSEQRSQAPHNWQLYT